MVGIASAKVFYFRYFCQHDNFFPKKSYLFIPEQFLYIGVVPHSYGNKFIVVITKQIHLSPLNLVITYCKQCYCHTMNPNDDD